MLALEPGALAAFLGRLLSVGMTAFLVLPSPALLAAAVATFFHDAPPAAAAAAKTEGAPAAAAAAAEPVTDWSAGGAGLRRRCRELVGRG